MDIGDLFRSFFGLRGRSGRLDHFPVHEDDFHDHGESGDSDDDDDGTEFPFFFGHGSSSMDDMFHHFHTDMHKQMEFLHRQMEDMLKGFGTITSENFPPEHRPGISDNPESHPGGPWFFNFPNAKPENEKKNPRDFFLKEDNEQNPQTVPSLPGPSSKGSDNFGSPFRIPPRSPTSQGERRDTDLDGKVSRADMMDLIKKPSGTQMEEQVTPNRGFFSGHSVSVTTVRGPDGKVEHKKIVKDSSGREESTVSRSVDGKTHTVTTIIGPGGQEEKHENLKNMDENDLSQFEERWKSQQTPKQSPNPPMLNPSTRLNPNDMDLFSRFFKNSWRD